MVKKGTGVQARNAGYRDTAVFSLSCSCQFDQKSIAQQIEFKEGNEMQQTRKHNSFQPLNKNVSFHILCL